PAHGAAPDEPPPLAVLPAPRDRPRPDEGGEHRRDPDRRGQVPPATRFLLGLVAGSRVVLPRLFRVRCGVLLLGTGLGAFGFAPSTPGQWGIVIHGRIGRVARPIPRGVLFPSR